MEDTLVPEKQKQILDRPPMYQVVIHNDDFTPFEFVIDMLASLFGMTGEEAERITKEIHEKDKCAVKQYTREIAETKASQCNDMAREHQHPLLVEAEKV